MFFIDWKKTFYFAFTSLTILVFHLSSHNIYLIYTKHTLWCRAILCGLWKVLEQVKTRSQRRWPNSWSSSQTWPSHPESTQLLSLLPGRTRRRNDNRERFKTLFQKYECRFLSADVFIHSKDIFIFLDSSNDAISIDILYNVFIIYWASFGGIIQFFILKHGSN